MSLCLVSVNVLLSLINPAPGIYELTTHRSGVTSWDDPRNEHGTRVRFYTYVWHVGRGFPFGWQLKAGPLLTGWFVLVSYQRVEQASGRWCCLSRRASLSRSFFSRYTTSSDSVSYNGLWSEAFSRYWIQFYGAMLVVVSSIGREYIANYQAKIRWVPSDVMRKFCLTI